MNGNLEYAKNPVPAFIYPTRIENARENTFNDMPSFQKLEKKGMMYRMPERRLHKRFNIKKGAFALLRSKKIYLDRINEMSMAEIAVSVLKSEAVKIGQIKDVSYGGISFCYFNCNSKSKSPRALDILVAGENFFLPDMSFKIISDVRVPRPFYETFKMRQISMQFEKMTMVKLQALEQFIRNQSLSAST